MSKLEKNELPGSLWLQKYLQPQPRGWGDIINFRFQNVQNMGQELWQQAKAELPDVGPRCDILPSHGRGCGPGSNTDNIRFDFFLLSAWEYSMPNHSGLEEEAGVICANCTFHSLLQKKLRWAARAYFRCKSLHKKMHTSLLGLSKQATAVVSPQLDHCDHALNFQTAM